MKYFSPAILDGSVTTAKLANDAVTRQKMDIFNNSQAGTIAIQFKVTVILAGGAFFPDIEGDMAASSTLDMQMLANFKAVPAASATSARFDLRNEDTGFARDYSVAWQQVVA